MVPATAALGATRMRVSMKYNGVPISCESFAYGQVEDYTLNLTSSAKAEAMALILYPNPVKGDVLTISISSAKSSYRIINTLGQEIGRGETIDGTIPVSTIGAGAYLLEVASAGKTAVRRFIKE